MTDDVVCSIFTDQINSLKELVSEKFDRVLENQQILTTRINTREQEIKDLETRVARLDKELVELRTEKDTSIRNTRYLVVIIGVILGALEIYILFSK